MSVQAERVADSRVFEAEVSRLLSAAKVLRLSHREHQAVRYGDFDWTSQLPSTIVAVTASSKVSSMGSGQYRAEAVLEADILTFPGRIAAVHTQTFGAGFSEREAMMVAATKAAENLVDQLQESSVR